MPKPYSTSLFIFRRDLRLEDNTGLNAALAQSERVIPCFIFDPRQIEKHPYQSLPALQFMLESLHDLDAALRARGSKLHFLNGLPHEVAARLEVDAIFANRDYTPFSRARDSVLPHAHFYPDALLNEPDSMLKTDGTAYQVFTAFYNRAQHYPVSLPAPLHTGTFALTQDDGFPQNLPISSQQCPIKGGRKAALALLDTLSHCADYAEKRDYPAHHATSDLSAYLKFGCCSVREAYHAVRDTLGAAHPLLRQFYWRDFFTHIGWNFPHVFKGAFHKQYDAIVWRKDKALFDAWAEGRTGFPIVDAGMRQLNQTGQMHNRVRMIVASFLTKDLHISWRWGERYFAQRLVDYDPCLNNGNWQWSASTGCDAQPYFRIFNPWLQQKKFDPDAVYIKRWIPELAAVPAAILHQWDKKAATIQSRYPAPMIDHATQSQQAKALFKACGADY